MFYVGVDPATNGAAVVVVADSDVVRAVSGFIWKPKTVAGTPGFELRYAIQTPNGWFNSRMGSIRTLGKIGETIRELLRSYALPYQLAGENPVMGRAMDTSITVARNAGRILGPLELLARNNETCWVRATEWRTAILGIPGRTLREQAKAASLRVMPARITDLPELFRILEGTDDLTDAAGVAEWLVRAEQDPSLRQAGSRKRKPKPPACSESGQNCGKKPEKPPAKAKPAANQSKKRCSPDTLASSLKNT